MIQNIYPIKSFIHQFILTQIKVYFTIYNFIILNGLPAPIIRLYSLLKKNPSQTLN